MQNSDNPNDNHTICLQLSHSMLNLSFFNIIVLLNYSVFYKSVWCSCSTIYTSKCHLSNTHMLKYPVYSIHKPCLQPYAHNARFKTCLAREIERSNSMQATQEVANDMAGICHVIHCTRCVKPCISCVVCIMLHA